MNDRLKRRIWHKPECMCGSCPEGKGVMECPPEGQTLDPIVFDLAGRVYGVEELFSTKQALIDSL